MNDNHNGHAVLSPRFAQNLVQCLEQLNNVDQFTDASNLALSFELFQLFQTVSSVALSNESPALLGGRPSLAAAARRPPLPTPAGRRPRNAPSQIERRAVRGFVSRKA
jgi:hypothetical protein